MTEEMLQQRVNFGRTHDPGVVRAKESETISEQKVWSGLTIYTGSA